MNIFKLSYKAVRENSKDIYKGFGFKHLSDATQYYVHPDNQSYKGTTTLCQSIGEALILFSLMLESNISEKAFGDYYYNEDKSNIFVQINIPEDYRTNAVVDNNIYSYKALKNNKSITISAYNQQGCWIDSNMEHFTPLYKLLPIFCVMFAYELETNTDFRLVMDNFIKEPAVDMFVNLHEDFYQAHKFDDYEINYEDIPEIDTEVYRSFSSSYKVIAENKLSMQLAKNTNIKPFCGHYFTDFQKQFIPSLGEEFALPNNLNSMCSAISNGEINSILFHGPSGTGKTISCKLIAQAIGLPIMETINCTENLDEFVLGKFIPQDDRIIFKESYVTKAIRDGGAVVFEEINFAKPQYLAFLNSLLDDNGFVRLDNGDVVKRNINFRFFATMNLGYFGTKELNQALYNRFNAIIELAALSDKAICLMLTTRIPECKKVVGKMLGIYHKLKKKIETEELDLVISPRNLENWARLAKYEGYINAAEKTIVPIAKCDRTMEDIIRGIIMLYKWE